MPNARCLSVVPTMKNSSENFYMRDVAANTLPKNGTDTVLKEPEIICELKDFAAETLSKNGTDKNFRADTLFSPITEPENMAILKAKFHEKIENFRFSIFFASFLQILFRFFKSKFSKKFVQFD
jgi:hypothetical protein